MKKEGLQGERVEGMAFHTGGHASSRDTVVVPDARSSIRPGGTRLPALPPQIEGIALDFLNIKKKILERKAVNNLLKDAPVPQKSNLDTLVGSALDRKGLSEEPRDSLTHEVISIAVATMTQPIEVVKKAANLFDEADKAIEDDEAKKAGLVRHFDKAEKAGLVKQHDIMQVVTGGVKAQDTARPVQTDLQAAQLKSITRRSADFAEGSEVSDEVLRRSVAKRAVEHQVTSLLGTMNGTGPAHELHEGLIHTAGEMAQLIVGELCQMARYEEIDHKVATSNANEHFIPSLDHKTVNPPLMVDVFTPKKDLVIRRANGQLDYNPNKLRKQVNVNGKDPLTTKQTRS